MTTPRIVTGLTATVAILTLAIGAGAFALSYDALHATGLEHGTFPAGLGWLFPLLIDLPLVIFTLALLVSQLTRQSGKLWAALVIVYTLATVGFNLAHAQPTPLGWLVAIVAPAGLLLTTEALRHLARGIIERGAAVVTLAELSQQAAQRRADLDRLQTELDTNAAKVAELKTELARLRNERKAEQYQNISNETRQQAMDILTERSDISGAELARLLGKSDTLARRLKRELLPVLNGGNGHHAGGVSL